MFVYDDAGRLVGLNINVNILDEVIWTGRKVGSCCDDGKFNIGQKYRVCGFYESNGDIEIEQYINGAHVTIRAGLSEYATLSPTNTGKTTSVRELLNN